MKVQVRLTSFNDIEQRLVFPHTTFAQIHELSHNSQLGLTSSIVNVVADTSKFQRILSRFLSNDESIVVGIKRKIEYKSTYLVGKVRPSIVMMAMNSLINTPLYTINNITINEDWLKSIQVQLQLQQQEVDNISNTERYNIRNKDTLTR